MTTNERMNCYRYRHFQVGTKGEIKSPFDRGVKLNCFNLLQWTCLGPVCKPDPVDWLSQFSVDSSTSEDTQPLLDQGFV